MSRRRNRQQAVPPQQLGFRAPSVQQFGFRGQWTCRSPTVDSWRTPIDAALERMLGAYESRQVKREHTEPLVNKELRWAPPLESILERHVIQDGFFQPQFSTENRFRQKTSPKVRMRVMEQPKNIRNKVFFEREIKELVESVGKTFRPPEWMAYSFCFFLGPAHLDFLYHTTPEVLRQRAHKIATYPANSSVVLFVNRSRDGPSTKQGVEEQILNRDIQKEHQNDYIYMSSPNSGYATLLKYGEEPVFIDKFEQLPYLVVIDNLCKNVREERRVLEIYEQELGCKLLGARLMRLVEKKYVEQLLDRDEISFLTMRLFEFESPEAKMEVVEKGDDWEKYRFLRIFYCDTMFDQMKCLEELFVTINYDLRPRAARNVRVTLALERDKEFALETLERHGLYPAFLNEEGRRDDDRKFSVDVKDFVIRQFPFHHRSFEQRKWLITRILNRNQIRFESIEEHVEQPTDGAYRALRRAKERNIKETIDYEVYGLAHRNGEYTPIRGDWDMGADGQRGARHFTKVVMERIDVPWTAMRVSQRDAADYEQCWALIFRDAKKSMRTVADIVGESSTEPIFRISEDDHVGPTFFPLHRMTIVVSRALRIACRDLIESHDRRLRHTFSTLSENEDPLMTRDESFFYSARIFEKWETSRDEEGMIGVQGWNQRGIRYFFGQFEGFLRPIEFNCEKQPELLFGVGERFVRSLPEKYEHKVLIDVDKFRRVISIFGSAASEARKDLETYSTKKSSIWIATEIVVELPEHEKEIIELMKGKVMERMGDWLGAEMRLFEQGGTPKIAFAGTVEQYETLTRALSLLTSEYYKKCTRTDPNLMLHCSACFSETGIDDDFYRLECGHSMCRPCLNNMIKSRIDEPFGQIKCEFAGCSQLIGPHELFRIILGDSRRVRELDHKKLSRLTARLKQWILNNSEGRMECCKSTDCSGIIIKSSDSSKIIIKECSSCSKRYCSACLAPPHPEYTCEQSARLQIPDNSIAEYLRTEGRGRVKACPQCQALVEKKEGCNHIECNCGIHFCWLCLHFDRNSGPIYTHMNEMHAGFGGDHWDIRNGQVIVRPENEMMNNLDEEDDLNLDMQRLMLGELPEQPQPAREFLQMLPPDAFVAPPPGLEPPPGIPIIPLEAHFEQIGAGPPLVLDEFPIVLLETFPDFYADEDLRMTLLARLNNAPTLAEQNERLAAMFEYPTAPRP